MKFVAKLLAIFVIAVCILASLLMLALWQRAATEPVAMSHAGVCAEASSQYSMEGGGDRIIVYDRDGARMQITVSDAAALSAVDLRAANQASGAIVPSISEPSEYVAAKSGVVMRVEFFDTAAAERDRLLAGTRFCESDSE